MITFDTLRIGLEDTFIEISGVIFTKYQVLYSRKILD